MFPTLGGARSESTGPGQAFLKPSTVNPGGWGRYVAGQTMGARAFVEGQVQRRFDSIMNQWVSL